MNPWPPSLPTAAGTPALQTRPGALEPRSPPPCRCGLEPWSPGAPHPAGAGHPRTAPRGCGGQGGDIAGCLRPPPEGWAGSCGPCGGLPAHGGSRTHPVQCSCPGSPAEGTASLSRRVSCAALKDPAGPGPCGRDAVLRAPEACGPHSLRRTRSTLQRAQATAQARDGGTPSPGSAATCTACSRRQVGEARCARRPHRLLKSRGFAGLHQKWPEPDNLASTASPRAAPRGSPHPAGTVQGTTQALPRRAIAFL